MCGFAGLAAAGGEEEASPREGRAPGAVRAASAPPLEKRGRRQKKPKEKGAEDTDRAQGEAALQRLQPAPLGRRTRATSVDVPPPSSKPGPSQTPFSSQGLRPAFAIPPRRQTSGRAHSGGSPGMAGTRQVEPSDWLKLRTVTLLLEHNQEGEPVAAPSGRTAPKEENRSPPREGKGQGGSSKENPRPPPGCEGSKDLGPGGGGQGGGAGKPPLKGRRRRTTPTSTTRKTRRKKRRRTTTR